jgi:hypothetical protein
MTKDEEYKLFCKYVFNEHIRVRIKELNTQGILLDERWLELKKAIYLLQYVNRHCHSDDDIGSTFTNQRIKLLINQVKEGIELNNELANKTGFSDALDAYYLELIEGLSVDYLLDENEIAILQDLGSLDPESEIAGMFYILKHRGARSLKNANETLRLYPETFPDKKSVSQCMEAVPKKVAEVLPISKDNNDKKLPRRWFKCAGKIARGAGISIGNIAFSATANAAIPGITIPIELVAGGAVGLGLASVLMGTAEVLEGAGELRGE